MHTELPYPNLFGLYRKHAIDELGRRAFVLAFSLIFVVVFSLGSFDNSTIYTLFVLSVTFASAFAVRVAIAGLKAYRFREVWRKHEGKLAMSEDWQELYENADHDVELGYTSYSRVVSTSNFLIVPDDVSGIYPLGDIEALYHDRLPRYEYSFRHSSSLQFKLTCKLKSGEKILLSKHDQEMKTIIEDLLEANQDIEMDAEAASLIGRVRQ